MALPSALPRTPSKPNSRRSRTKRRILAVTSLGLAGLLAGLLSGCSTGINASVAAGSAHSYADVSGNWQVTSTDPAAASTLSSFGGSLSVSPAGSQGWTVSGTLHPLASHCAPLTTAIPVSGTIDEAGKLTITGPLLTGLLTLSGTLTADGKSLTTPSYSVTGGTCALSPHLAAISSRDNTSPVTAQQYQPVSGTFSGSLTTSEGETFVLTSTLTQTSQPDANGTYHVSGTASSPGNACVPSSLPAVASTIDGGSISTTYADSASGTSITASGNTSPDGTSITIASWQINSPCGSDSGTGSLTRQ